MESDRGPRIFISAGELSGDLVGARLTAAVLRRDGGASVWGAGGRAMADAGVAIESHTGDIGVVGVTETLSAAPSVVRALRRIRRRIRREPPDAAVLIGNDVFNVLLARRLRARGIPALAYFPPQVWLWRSLARPIARSFDAIFTSFPEEHAVYAQASDRTRVSFVGHYLADDLSPATPAERAAARAQLELPQDVPVVGLLPGSRTHEVRVLSPVFFDAAERLLAAHDNAWFVLAAAPGVDRDALARASGRRSIASRMRIVTGGHSAMRAADLLLLASGTASLEAALVGTPMVIAYRLSAATHLVIRAAMALGLIDAYVVGLPNLITGRSVVPEVLQRRLTAATLADEASALLVSPDRLARMRADLATIAHQLRAGRSVDDVADAVLAWADEGRRRAAARCSRWTSQPRRQPLRVPEAK